MLHLGKKRNVSFNLAHKPFSCGYINTSFKHKWCILLLRVTFHCNCHYSCQTYYIEHVTAIARWLPVQLQSEKHIVTNWTHTVRPFWTRAIFHLHFLCVFFSSLCLSLFRRGMVWIQTHCTCQSFHQNGASWIVSRAFQVHFEKKKKQHRIYLKNSVIIIYST